MQSHKIFFFNLFDTFIYLYLFYYILNCLNFFFFFNLIFKNYLFDILKLLIKKIKFNIKFEWFEKKKIYIYL